MLLNANTKTLQGRLRLLLTIALGLVLSMALSFGLLSLERNVANAGAPTCTWTGAGADTNFSTAGNWSCEAGVIPDDGTTIIFPSTATNRIANNDLASTKVFSGVVFDGNAADCTTGFPYSISGNIYLSGDVADRNGAGCSVGVPPGGENSYGTTFNGVLTLKSNSNILTGDVLVLRGGIDIGTYNATFSKGLNISVSSSPSIYVGGYISSAFNEAIIGSGVVNIGDSFDFRMLAPAPNFSGFLVVNGSTNVQVGGQFWTTPSPFNQSLGTATVTLNGTSTLRYFLYYGFSGTTITIPNSINVNSTGLWGSEAQLSIQSGDSDLSISNNASITSVIGSSFGTVYKKLDSGKTINFTGSIALTTNLMIESSIQTTSLTGALSGSGYFIYNQPSVVNRGFAGSIAVNGSTNTTSTPNSTIAQVTSTYSMGFDDGSTNYYVGRLFNFDLGGHIVGAVLIQNSGTLSGSGTVGNLTTQSGIVSPGSTSATLNTGSILLDSGSSYETRIAGTSAGQYSQLNATGTVSLGNAVLDIADDSGFTPSINDTFTIINNDGSDAVTGTFNGVAQNTKVIFNGYTYRVSYIGGTGNDVTLTVTGTPGAPDTSGVLARPTSVALAVGVVVSGVGALALRSRYLKTIRKTVRTRR